MIARWIRAGAADDQEAGHVSRHHLIAAVGGWLRDSRGGLFALALLVGIGAGFGAVVFRYLIAAFTWIFTGHRAFGQQGYVSSAHMPWFGLAFFVIAPVVGGFIYGPVIYKWAREARGHGVPEVMIAVADSGGRIRPQVSAVKAVASAICIGAGGSVGREGPIVQIGATLASTLGQWVRMPENRMKILVAAGAGGGIAATFNAPITGVFFGVEIILREFSIEALFTVMLASMLADVIGEAFLGHSRFLIGFPTGIVLHNPRSYLLIAILAVIAGLLGVGFKTVLYKAEDVWDRLWRNRPEWARPGVGGIALGLLLLALPQLYGVGYPVMYKTVAGGYALWFLLVLAAGKMLACSTTIGIGGSGGVFAPSLFIGATSGMAFGEIASHVFGPSAGNPALYAAVAMGGVFAAAARAPLTSLASVVEMTGDYTLTLPVMLAIAVSTAVSRGLSYGTIYTTKLLRRGTDIDRPAPWRALAAMTVADVMRPFKEPLAVEAGAVVPSASPAQAGPGAPESNSGDGQAPGQGGPNGALPGPAVELGEPQALFASESLEQALRQLLVYDSNGLPVLSAGGNRVLGWLTNKVVVNALATKIHGSGAEVARDALAADWASPDPQAAIRRPSNPLRGYQMMEVAVQERSATAGTKLGHLSWPAGYLPVSVRRRGRVIEPDHTLTMKPGDRIIVLVRRQRAGSPGTDATDKAARVPGTGAVNDGHDTQHP